MSNVVHWKTQVVVVMTSFARSDTALPPELRVTRECVSD